MKLNKLVGRSQKGSLITFLLVLGIIGITLITGVISLELLIRWVSLGRIQHAAQQAAVTYAKSMHRLRHNQMSQHSVQAIDYTYSGLALPATSTPINGSLSSVKGASDLEYTQASQVLLSNIWGIRVSDSALIDDVRQNQCYKTQEESRFNKNANSPRNNCDGIGKVSSPIMSLKWNFQSSAYGYGVCCPLGNNDSNKDFCVNVNVSGRMDPVMAGGLPFLHNVEFIKDGNFNINARTVVMKMAAGASGSSSEDITAEQMPSGSVKCPINSPGIPPVPVLRPAQVEALVKANCYHPEFGIIHDGIAILGNAKQNCQPEKYAKPANKVPYCPPGSPGCPLTANDSSDLSANYPGSEAPRENPVCLDTAFNEQYYLNKYPDVAALVKRGAISSGSEHFQKFGQGEGREGSSCCSGRKCRVPVCLPGSPGCCLADEIYDPSLKKCMKCKPGETYDGVKRICIKCVPGSPGCCLAGENYFMTKTGPLCCPADRTPGMVDGQSRCLPKGECGPGVPGYNPITKTCAPEACGPGMPNYNPQTKTCTPDNCPANEYMVPGSNPSTCCPVNMTIIDTSGECKPCPNGMMPNPQTGRCEPAPTCGPGMPGYDPQTKTCCGPGMPGYDPQTKTCCGPGMPGYDPQTKTCCGPGMPNYNPQTKTCTPSNCQANEYMVPGTNPPTCCPTNMTIIDTSGQCKPCPNGMMPNPTNGKCEPATTTSTPPNATGDCREGMPNYNPQTRTCTPPTATPSLRKCDSNNNNGLYQVNRYQTVGKDIDMLNKCASNYICPEYMDCSQTQVWAWLEVSGCDSNKADSYGNMGRCYADPSSCLISRSVPEAACIKGEINIVSPISLVWSVNESNNNKIIATKFPLNPSIKGKWFQWKASSQRPLIVYDPNHEGKITSSSQLMGSFTFGKKWNDGYEALSTLDKNHDGKLTNLELKDLALWFDNNQDGVSQRGEVKSLKQMNLTTIFVKPDSSNINTHDIYAKVGYEKTVNGKKFIGESVDWFVGDGFNTEEEAILGKNMIFSLGFLSTEKGKI